MMKKISLTIASILIITFISTTMAFADDIYDLTGYVTFKNRFTIEPEERSEFNYNEAILGMKLTAYPTDRVSLVGSVKLDAFYMEENLGNDNSFDIHQQQDRTNLDPVRLELDDAYVTISGLGLSDLDLKIGKQRITWGTGDQFNPTDNLNPDDFHDPLAFGNKYTVPAFKADYYLGPLTVTGVYIPLFYPALLPRTDIRPIFEKQFEELSDEFDIDTGDPTLDVIFDAFLIPALQTAELGDVMVRSKLPDRALSNGNGAIKVAATAGPVDFSLSYAYVRDDFGVPKTINMKVDPFSAGTLIIIDKVDLEVEQEYPRTQVIGADFAMTVPFLDIGVWGEGAYNIPEPYKTQYLLDMGHNTNYLVGLLGNEEYPDGIVIAEDDPLEDSYIRGVAGIDYTFPGAFYLNAQYIRGLPSDNTAELVDDYLFGGFDKPFLNGTIKPRIFSGVCFSDSSWILFPELLIAPLDSLEINLGALLVYGDIDTKFGAFGHDIVFTKVKVSF